VFSALLDTCVLVPSVKRDVLLEIAERTVYRPLWSSEILGELSRAIHTIRSVRGDAPQVTETYVRRLTMQMAVAFPDALVAGWERLVNTIDLPDPNDRHVVAAAVAGRADVIVTENRKHFPTEQLPSPLFTQTTDTFLLDSFDLYPEPVMTAVRCVADRTGRYGPPRTVIDIANWLGKTGSPQFAAALLDAM
jgi:predicted nucleic acid-binding protein